MLWNHRSRKTLAAPFGKDRYFQIACGVTFLLGDNSGLLYSSDGGAKWRMLGNPPGKDQPRYNTMVVLPGDNPTFLLSIMDEGRAWRFGLTP
jgi:hypothetical protein